MENNILNGFEVFDDFVPGGNINRTASQSEPNKLDLGGVGEELTDEELEALKNKKQPKQEVEVEDEAIEEEEEEPKKKSTKKAPVKEEVEEEIELEEDDDDKEDTTGDSTVSAFFGVLSEKMGWELDEEAEVPSTPEELIEYFKEVIEENSVPQYASEEVEALDNFVKNGGNLREYFEVQGELDLETIELEDNDTNQKLVLKEFLKEKGFTSKLIEKKLTKYDEAGLLEDEATDALEALRDIKEQKKQQLLEQLETRAKEAAKKQQAYFTSVVNEIKGMDNIRGVKIPEKDKKVLLEYIFKPDADGMTKFNKDWSKSVKNLIESAYFTMKGDTLMKAAKSEGSNAAINRFKDSLNKTGVSRKTKKQNNTSTETMWNSFVRQFRAE